LRRRRQTWIILTAAAGALALGAAGTAASARTAAVPTGPVSGTPAAGTPQLATTGSTEQVRQLVQCGSTMYAVGSFSSVKRYNNVVSRGNIFSFSAVKPYKMTTWNPNVNGVVNSIAFNGSNCADAYIGGKFTSVGGTAVKNIAEVSTSTGQVVTSFGHNAEAQVQTLLAVKGHLLAGGNFTSVNNSTADPYFASLSPATGKDDNWFHLSISGNYNWTPFNGDPPVATNPTRVYNQSLSHSGQYDLLMGDFTAAGGLPRQQIFMLNLSTTPPSVTGWTSPEWDGSLGEATPQDPTAGYPYHCAWNEPFYIQAASWSPDDSTIYIANTGYHPYGWSTDPNEQVRNGLCDAAAAFPATVNPPPQSDGQPGYVLHDWVNYTGCDSLFATAADASTAYIGGHERWSSNPNGCDNAGPGAISAPGMEGLSPATGALTFNPGRARGLGADDMLITSAGLWIASDNLDNSQTCGGVASHAGICLLPYTTG
jgi:hypothetical protein